MADSTSADLSFSLAAVPPSSFTYVAEGGANLVAAYTGNTANDGFLQGTVLRIRKKAHGAPVLSDTTLSEEDASVAFTDKVVVPLLPPRSTPRLVSIPIHDKGWFDELAKHLQPARPASRKAIDDIDTDRGYVVLADNLVGTATDGTMQLAVEIKPKWGFLPNPFFLSQKSHPVKTNHCRFCLHRLHKSKAPRGHASHSSADEYCPLDLYSGDRERVLKALHALVKSWEQTNGKGNNLKLFYEGKMVIPSQNTGFLGDTDDTAHSLPDLLASFMCSSPLVKRLSYLQKALDPLDIEGLNTLLKEQQGVDLLATDEDNLVLNLGNEVSLDEYTQLVEFFLASESVTYDQQQTSLNMPSSSFDSTQSREPSIRNGTPFFDEQTPLRTLVIAYLLSASFKDCSMIIKVSQDASSDNQNKTLEAYLVDVDVKSIKRLARYAKLDRDLVDSCLSYQETGGVMPHCRI